MDATSGSPMSDTVIFDYRDIFTIVQYDAIYRKIFQALNWSKMSVIYSKNWTGIVYVEILAVFYDFTTKIVYLCFFTTNMQYFNYHEWK